MTAPAPQSQPGTDDLPATPWQAGGVTKDRFVTAGTEREGIFSLGDVNIFPASGPGPVAIAAGAEIAAQIVDAVNSHATLQARVEELTKTLEWQPIETAPKDGSKIDLLYAHPRGRTIDCMWRQGGVDGDGHWIWLKPIWSSQPGLGIDWHLTPESDWEVCSYPNMEPTHWMRAVALPLEGRGGAT